MSNPKVGIIMGSQSDLKVMAEAAQVLDELKVPYEVTIVSSLILAIVLYLDPVYNATLLPGGAFALVVFPLFVGI